MKLAVKYSALIIAVAECVQPCTPAALAEPSPAEVRAWLLNERGEASTFGSFGPVRIEYRAEHPDTTDPATLAQWRRDVEGKPSHPLRQKIDKVQRRLKNGPDVNEYTLWLLDENRWRLNDNHGYLGEIAYTDSAANGSDLWQLNPTTLWAFDSTSGEQVAEGPRNVRTSFQNDLSFLVYGGLHRTVNPWPDSFEVQIEGDSWTAVVANDRGWRWRLSGIWSASDQAGRITRFEETRAGAERPTFIVAFEGHRHYPALGRTAAGLVRMEMLDPPLGTQLLRFIDAYPEDSRSVRQVLAPPDPLGADAVRGILTVSRFNDHRASSHTATTLQDGRAIGTAPIAVPISIREQRPLQVLGWVTAGVLLAAFIGLRVVKRR